MSAREKTEPLEWIIWFPYMAAVAFFFAYWWSYETTMNDRCVPTGESRSFIAEEGAPPILQRQWTCGNEALYWEDLK